MINTWWARSTNHHTKLNRSVGDVVIVMSEGRHWHWAPQQGNWSVEGSRSRPSSIPRSRDRESSHEPATDQTPLHESVILSGAGTLGSRLGHHWAWVGSLGAGRAQRLFFPLEPSRNVRWALRTPWGRDPSSIAAPLAIGVCVCSFSLALA
jgi:hypothetical protein